jgi:Na+/proline symporter
MPEYLEKRYKSPVMRGIMTFIALVSYVFTKISVSIHAVYVNITISVQHCNESS